MSERRADSRSGLVLAGCRLLTNDVFADGPPGTVDFVQRDEITPDVAARLVREQFPEWADLPISQVGLNGWDNTTFRLGDQLAVRLPNGEGYAAAVAKEHRWLPALAPELPLPIPQPVAMGLPGGGYPWPWSINRWLVGEPASLGRIDDLSTFAADLGDFLTALGAVDTADGPLAGPHSAHRGGPLTYFDDEEIPEAIDLVADRVDADAVSEVWQAALTSNWQRSPVWVHGDVVGSNLLVVDGALSAVIDFGCSAIGDPACDLAMAWTFFDGDSTEQFRQHLSVDEATWARGRGWALWKALVTILRSRENARDEYVDARRFGWRYNPYEVIEHVIADHRRSTWHVATRAVRQTHR